MKEIQRKNTKIQTPILTRRSPLASKWSEQRVQSLTFLLALRRSALSLAFSSSLRSSSPLTAPWNTPTRGTCVTPCAVLHPKLPDAVTLFVYLGQTSIIAGVRGGGTTVHLLLRLLDRGACWETAFSQRRLGPKFYPKYQNRKLKFQREKKKKKDFIFVQNHPAI